MTIVDKSEPQTRLQVCAKSLLHWLNFFRKDIYIYTLNPIEIYI